MTYIRKKFGPFEFEVFKVKYGWSWNWVFRIKNKIVFHIGLFRRD